MLQLSEQALEQFIETHFVARRILLIDWKFRFQLIGGLNRHTTFAHLAHLAHLPS
jgi:hypothetical protein